jgi:putative transposon-encoded protein
VIPYKLSPDEQVELMSDAFRLAFGNQVDEIRVQNIRKGSSAAVINLPKEYINKVATVIIWKNKHKFYERSPANELDRLKEKSNIIPK